MGVGVQIGLMAASTALTVHSQQQAAGAKEVELELAQRQEAQAARDREVQRKRRLNAVLGAQRAQAAASGLSMSGSVGNISITDAQRAGEESLVDDVNTRARINALRRQKRTVRRQANVRGATTIMSNVARSARRGDFQQLGSSGGGGGGSGGGGP